VRAAAAGLPVVPTLAEGSGRQDFEAGEHWPAGDLVSKSALGSRGDGFQRWTAHAGQYLDERGEGLSRDALLARLSASGSPWLLQRALAADPGLGDIAGERLLTVRAMTVRGRDGVCRLFAALLKMPVGRATLTTHGIGAAIDIASGILGPAHSYRPLDVAYDLHPDTRAKIVGRLVPGWPAIRALSTSAHASLTEARLIGWDIALTAEGPLLLEANLGWDVVLPQRVTQTPLVPLLIDLLPDVAWPG
jgi:hypothetical protein